VAINNYSMKAKFESVKFDLDAVNFHAEKYLNGSVYPLSKQCFQLREVLRNRSIYQIYLDELEENLGTSNTKP
jgi:hypothetical protein